MSRLLAIDPSLTCSGWAFFRVADSQLLAVGKIKSLPPSQPLANRLLRLQAHVEQLYSDLAATTTDYLVCEAATTMRDPNATLKVEQVRGIFEVVARQHGLSVPGRINPRSVQFELLGLVGHQQGRAAVKDAALNFAHRLYAASLQSLGLPTDLGQLKRNQDIVDAILIGHLATSRLRTAFSAGMRVEEYFELSARETTALRYRRNAA